jgi:hypothetical protein
VKWSVALCAVTCTVGCGRVGFDPAAGLSPIQVAAPPFTTANQEFTNVPGSTLEIPSSPGVSWLVLTSAILQSSSFGEVDVEARYLVDGVERGIGGTQNAAIDRGGPWQHFVLIDGGATAQLVTYELRAAVATASIDRLVALAVPLPAASDPLYATMDPIQSVTGNTPMPYASFTLSPASAGDYVVLLLGNLSERPNGSNIYLNWEAPPGGAWSDEFRLTRQPWQSYLTMGRATLGPDPVAIKAMSHTSSVSASLQYLRVLALRTDGFASAELAFDSTADLVTSTALSVTNTLVAQASAAASYILVTTADVGETCTVGGAERGTYVIVDGVEEFATHFVTENCAYEHTSGTARLHSTRPAMIETAVSAGNGGEVTEKESAILLLGLD